VVLAPIILVLIKEVQDLIIWELCGGGMISLVALFSCIWLAQQGQVELKIEVQDSIQSQFCSLRREAYRSSKDLDWI